MNCKYPKNSLNIIWYNLKLTVRKLQVGDYGFFILYSLNEIVHILQMKMEYFIYDVVCSVVCLY